MIAITTQYHGHTAHRPSSVTARTANGHKLTMTYDSDADPEAAHAKVAVELCKSMGWTGTLVAGGIKNGYVFVFRNQTSRYPIR